MASPTPPSPSDPPSAVPLALPVAAPPSSRRLPPPCWSPDETLALIDAYRDKWYSLARGNLKATHWQEVADAVAHRCPNASPPKTPVQCRHKMEKLRKRYRTEIQRARSLPLSRFNSSWVHFKLMDSMEKGPSPVKPQNDSDSADDDDDDHDPFQDIHNNNAGHGSNTRSLNKLYRNGFGGSGGPGFRIRIPTAPKMFPNQKFNPNLNQNPASNFGAKKRDPVGEVVSAIKVLGDGFVRMEQMKMEMAREIETMRMEMEMKRTEMILDSQHRILEAFAKALSDNNKKPKTVPSPQQP
ncbi:trihelix transcription factor ASIL1-like [Abrus precatorius]|uniref:Trihelix transcription factor ASIL1-like n=1 Tax=Abrus precatorius TaxID=3816 RepID=A0A8B8JI48_ABRPR|nr:trihelix transcription factor ASIL1-like [Abrus precatorius]